VKPLVSILIPCYNAESWIRQCIQSALDQTWPNKEIIVIDDGSTDASVAAIKTFGDRILFQASPHAGGNPTRNRLTQLAQGEWLQYLDADDYLLPGKIASQLAGIGQSESNVDVIYSPVIVRDMERSGAERVLEIREHDATLTLIRWGSLNTGGLLLRRETLVAAGGWKRDQPCCQEHELLLRLQLAGNRFLLHNRVEAVYRHHSSATVSRRDPLLTIRTRMELTDQLEEHLNASGRLGPAHRVALFAARMECARSAYRLDLPLAQELCRKAEAHGRKWVSGSPALPPGYQLGLRLAGFVNTERVAEWVRGPHSGLRLAL
jgi:glycosyltransferase involved in cell wall biosynthesis